MFMSNQSPYIQPEAGGQPPDTNQPARGPGFTPWVTYILMGVTLLIFAGQYLTQSQLGIDLFAVYGMKINRAIISGELWRLVTPIFLHGSLTHIGFNMYALFILGPGLERTYGRSRYLMLYFLSGIAGNVVSFYFSPNNSLGASTSIFGLVAAQGVFIFRNREFFGKQARSLLGNLFLIVAVNLMLGLMPGIDNWGHMGGLLGGLAFAWTSGPLLAVNWLPGGGGYRMVDQNLSTQVWLNAFVVLAVLVGLVFLKIANP
jgi:rhomboid protease GluP